MAFNTRAPFAGAQALQPFACRHLSLALPFASCWLMRSVSAAMCPMTTPMFDKPMNIRLYPLSPKADSSAAQKLTLVTLSLSCCRLSSSRGSRSALVTRQVLLWNR